MSRRVLARWSIAGVFSVALLGAGVAHAADSPSTSSVPATSMSTSMVPASVRATTTAVSRTTVATSTTVPVPSVLVPTAPTWHLEGQHSGVEHFVISGGEGCAFLNHHLVETMILTDGTVWQLREHYCGIITNINVWSGAGTVLISAPNGTLTGSFRHSARLPSLGVPYQLDIASGTGTYAGAHGSCTLDDHLQSKVFGVQEHHGSFSCDLYR